MRARLAISAGGIVAVFALFFAARVGATDFKGSTFIIRDPVVSGGLTGESSSANFRLLQSLGLPAIGESASSTFTGRSGFLYFPVVTTPALTASPRDRAVRLTWSPAVGFLGWNVSGYNVGIAGVAGGPYTYTEAGNVFEYTNSGLNNEQTYYFIVRPEDAFGFSIATSSEVSAVPRATLPGGPPPGPPGPPPPSPPPAPPPIVSPDAILRGRAFPDAPVIVLRDGVIIGRFRADGAGNFEIPLSGLPTGNSQFSLYAVDDAGRESAAVPLVLDVTPGHTVEANGIFIPPTVDVDHISVRPGDPLRIVGQAYPGSEILIMVKNETAAAAEAVIHAAADGRGHFSYILPTAGLARGTYSVQAEEALAGAVSPRSRMVYFVVGEQTIPKPTVIPLPPEFLNLPEAVRARLLRGCRRADLNCDGRVDIVDFSILLYWWQQPIPESLRPIIDLANDDGVVDLFDFSVLVYYWTG